MMRATALFVAGTVAVTATDCGAFPTCNADAPCLQKTGDCTAKPMDAATACEPCTSFGNGGGDGSVCPGGATYEVAKEKCLSQEQAAWEPVGCVCTVGTTQCKNGDDYKTAQEKCKLAQGLFNTRDCTCQTDVCPDGTSRDQSKLKCLVNSDSTTKPDAVWDPVDCTCATKTPDGIDCVQVELGCKEAIDAGKEVEFLMATVDDVCKCAYIGAISSTAVRPDGAQTVVPKLAEFTGKIVLKGVTAAQLKDLYVTLVQKFQELFKREFPDVTFVVLGMEEGADFVAIKFAIRGSDEAAVKKMQVWVKEYLASATAQADLKAVTNLDITAQLTDDAVTLASDTTVVGTAKDVDDASAASHVVALSVFAVAAVGLA